MSKEISRLKYCKILRVSVSFQKYEIGRLFRENGLQGK